MDERLDLLVVTCKQFWGDRYCHSLKPEISLPVDQALASLNFEERFFYCIDVYKLRGRAPLLDVISIAGSQ
jgi:hypothetical protein